MGKKIIERQKKSKADEVEGILKELGRLGDCSLIKDQFVWESGIESISGDHNELETYSDGEIGLLQVKLLAGKALEKLGNDASWGEVSEYINQEVEKICGDGDREAFDEILCEEILINAVPFLKTLFIDAIYGSSMPESIRDDFEEARKEQNCGLTARIVVPIISLATKAEKEGKIERLPDEIIELENRYFDKVNDYQRYCTRFGSYNWENSIRRSLSNTENNNIGYIVQCLENQEIVGKIMELIAKKVSEEEAIERSIPQNFDLKRRHNIAKLAAMYADNGSELFNLICQGFTQPKSESKEKLAIKKQDEEYKQIEEEFFRISHDDLDKEEEKKLWEKVKSDSSLLNWALTIVPTDTGTTLKGRYIVDYIVRYHMDDVTKKVRSNIVNTIVSNRDIQLLASNQIQRKNESLLFLLVSNPSIYFGKSAKEKIVKSAANDLSYHGRGTYNIRYSLLKNPNWSYDEKLDLVKRFFTFTNSEMFDDYISTLELAVLNDEVNTDSVGFEQYQMYTYSLDDLKGMYNSEIEARRIMADIDLCRALRFMQDQLTQTALIEDTYKNVINTKKDVGFNLYPIETEDTKDDDDYTENPIYSFKDTDVVRLAREHYGSNIDLNNLRFVAESISSDVANNYFARRVAKDVLRSLGHTEFEDEPTYMARAYIDAGVSPTIFGSNPKEPTQNTKKEVIWFFAKELGLIDNSLIDYIGDIEEFKRKMEGYIVSSITCMTKNGVESSLGYRAYRDDRPKHLAFMKKAILRRKKEREEE